MPHVSATSVRAMTSQGDLEYGGGGSVTGYGANAARIPQVAGVTPYANGAANPGGAYPANAFDGGGEWRVYDGDDNTEGQQNGFAGSTRAVDLGTAQRIGKYRVRNSATANRQSRSLRLEYSTGDMSGPWFTADFSLTAQFLDSGQITFTPIRARYWRLYLVTAGPWDWGLSAFELYPVTTVGAGNPTRLAGPAVRSPLIYDPAAGVPLWGSQAAAIADKGANVGEANNAASGTLMATKAELDATDAKLNLILATLRQNGLIGS